MTELVGIAAVVLVAWFALGTIWNVRKGSASMRWMHGGLPVIGGRTTVRWLGSSAVEMAIRDPVAPFSAATIVVFLEPRDLPWWPLSHWLAARRDTLIFRGNLRAAPPLELEAVDPASWSGRDALARIPRDWSVRGAGAGNDLAVHYAQPAALERADALLAQCRAAGLAVRRLAVRRAEPAFQLHVALPGEGQSAREIFDTLHRVAESASR